MRNNPPYIISRESGLPETEELQTAWSLPGGIIGFCSWLLALGLPFLLFGSNTPFFFLYTWPFFLALMPVAVVVGIALHSLVGRRLLISIIATLLVVVAMFGALFLWLTH